MPDYGKDSTDGSSEHLLLSSAWLGTFTRPINTDQNREHSVGKVEIDIRFVNNEGVGSSLSSLLPLALLTPLSLLSIRKLNSLSRYLKLVLSGIFSRIRNWCLQN